MVRTRRLAIPTLLLFLLAGCATPDQGPSAKGVGDDTSTTPDPKRTFYVPSEHTKAYEVGNATYAANLTGDFVVSFAFAVAEPSECEIDVAATGRTLEAGPEFAFRMANETWEGWYVGARSSAVHVHGLDAADTRALFQSGQAWVGRVQRTFELEDVMNVTIAVRALETHAGFALVDLPENTSFGLRFDCAGAWQARRIAAGHELVLFNHATLDGGAGASTNLPGARPSVAVQDGFDRKMNASDVRFFAANIDGAGTFSLDHPAGTRSWDLPPVYGTMEFQGGKGDYSGRLTRAGAGVFWGFLGGLSSLPSIDGVATLPPG